MPLWRTPSKRSFKHNVRLETKVGKRRGYPPKAASKRAVAIAFDIQEKAKRKRRK